MNESAPPAAPYKGLVPYAEEDAPFFFGRDPDREIILANLMARRLTLLYGPSGVGKSSVLRAGVAHQLLEQARRNLAKHGAPEFAVVVFNEWRDDPMPALKAQIERAVAHSFNGNAAQPPPEDSPADFVDMLKACAKRLGHQDEAGASVHVGGRLFVILDQFEEYFLYQAQGNSQGTFVVEFPRAANDPDLPINFIISIREDAYAKLDRFEGRIPRLFDNYLRIEHLDREAACEAIEGPIERYNQLLEEGDQEIVIEPALIDAVLDQVKIGQVVIGEAGRGVIGGEVGEAQIETPFLQLVMTRLWQEEMRADSRMLRLETLRRLGGAEHIVRTHLDEAMNSLSPEEQDVAARIFHYLVTPSGTKIAYSIRDLVIYAGLGMKRITPVVRHLSSGDVRILRPVAPPPDQPQGFQRYEVFHDVLAEAILDWRWRYMQEQDKAEARDRAAKEAAEQEREASRRRELEQAQALAMEQQRRAEVEHQRAEEQQRRAEEEARAASRMRRLISALLVACLAAVVLAMLAAFSWRKAQEQFHYAEVQAHVAMEAEKLAREAQELAKQRLERIKDSILLKQAALSKDPERTRTALESNPVNNQIAFRVTAECTGKRGWQGRPVYLFKLFPKADSIPGGLESIASVTYKMDHPSFLIDEGLRNTLFLTGQDTNFTFSYNGWGGLSQVIAVIEYTDPDKAPAITSFNMIEKLYGAWPNCAR